MKSEETAPLSPGPLFRTEAVTAASARLGSPVRPVGVAGWVLTIFLVSVFVVVFSFLANAKYARKETVPGELEPTAGALRITVSKPAVISQVHVRDGQFVEAGAPIVTLGLDPVIDGGESLGRALNKASRAQEDALTAQSQAHAQSSSRQDAEIVAKLRGLAVQQERLRYDLKLQRERLSLSQASLDAVGPLHDRGFFSDLQLRQRQEALVEAEQGASAIEKQIEDNDALTRELTADKQRLVADAAEVQAQLVGANAQVAEKRATYAAESQIVLTAPQAGQVVALQAKPGAAAPASTALAVVLPRGSKLEAVLWAPSRSIGFVRPGAEVRLMYDAFPYQHFGVARGRVTSIADAPTNPNEMPVPIEAKEALYRVTVALDRQSIDAYGRSWALPPGGRLSADLVLESRSFLDWLMDPLLSAKRRAA